MSLSGHVNDKNKYILIFGKGTTQGLDNSLLTVQVEYSINFSRSERKFCLSLHYNPRNSFLFVNAIKIYKTIFIMFRKYFKRLHS